MTRVTLTTANTPGAVAILQLYGDGVTDVLQQLTGRDHWPVRRAFRCRFAEIDEGLAVLINREAAQLMPHGGPRVVQKLIAHLTGGLGCCYDADPDTQALYLESASPIEADMLDAIARAASPAAIDLLAKQPTLWRGLLQQPGEVSETQRQAIAERSRILDRLITPPTVVVVGPANVGKSTLTNALMGKAVSIVADLPGTTRDWVGGLVELNVRCPMSDVRSQGNIAHRTSDIAHTAVAVHWLDTPGLRDSDDAIEQRAIQLAKQQIEQADVLIAMRDPDQPWPGPDAMPRRPDLWVVNKADDASLSRNDTSGNSSESPLRISAKLERGIDLLQSAVIAKLGLTALHQPTPWAFSNELKAYCDAAAPDLTAYLGSS